ncbi:unnamed protein product [Medioppia subpectinata]|uniref:C2H2-type domain-containing protein n=1 Tax=Medioppia subpectinata TaxID=1979941 RepID=A0A7R9KHM8_9ACAR|nr:unnamed protein product [Medioppia subpectinata]CAG2103529.1 unnamed protein product [Medioppia subpectinata]
MNKLNLSGSSDGHQSGDKRNNNCENGKRFKWKRPPKRPSRHSRQTSNYYRMCDKYQCSECFNWLPSETALETHSNKYHKNSKPFVCVTHSNKYHKNSKPFVCVVCKATFFANLSLLNHLSQTHQMSAFACDSCDYKTRTKHHLIQHMITHSKDRPYKCHFKGCNKSFKRKFELIRHNILHKKRFQCKECNESFKDNPSLLNHLSLKHKISLFECDLCCYKTKIKHHLIQHMVTHSNERPFGCHIHGCNQTFKRKDMLIRHERLHHYNENEMSDTVLDEDFSFVDSAEEVMPSRGLNAGHIGHNTGHTIEDQISNNYYVAREEQSFQLLPYFGYSEEYLSLIHSKTGIDAIRRTALQSGLRSCRFRLYIESIYHINKFGVFHTNVDLTIFLECLPETSEERITKIAELRSKYEFEGTYPVRPSLSSTNHHWVLPFRSRSLSTATEFEGPFEDISTLLELSQCDHNVVLVSKSFGGQHSLQGIQLSSDSPSVGKSMDEMCVNSFSCLPFGALLTTLSGLCLRASTDSTARWLKWSGVLWGWISHQMVETLGVITAQKNLTPNTENNEVSVGAENGSMFMVSVGYQAINREKIIPKLYINTAILKNKNNTIQVSLLIMNPNISLPEEFILGNSLTMLSNGIYIGAISLSNL